MLKFLPKLVRSEWRIRFVVGYAALAFLPLALTVLVLATKYDVLQSTVALDQAQVARHIVNGEGFSTSLIRPLSLVFCAATANHPDLYNPPLPPLILSLFYSVLRPSPRVTAGAFLVVWIGSIWLCFLMGRRLAGGALAGLAAVFYGSNVATLLSTVQGLSYATASVFVLLAVWLTFLHRSTKEPANLLELPWWRLFLGGVASALAFLTNFLMLPVFLVLVVYLAKAERRKLRGLFLFAGGFLFAIVPWMWRNARIEGAPLFGIYWYELLARTTAYPGDSVWRSLSLPQNPLLFLLSHPLPILRKLLTGLAEFRGQTLGLMEPVILFLVVAALLNIEISRRWRTLAGVVVAGVLTSVLLSSMLRSEPGIVLAWVPLACIVAAAQLSDWVHRRIGRFYREGLRISLPRSVLAVRRREPPKRITVGRINVGSRVSRFVVLAAVVAIVVFPLLYFLVVYRPSSGSALVSLAMNLDSQLPAQATVMTDQPAIVAWYSRRPAVWLCQKESELMGYEDVVGPVDAFFVTGAVAQLPEEERGDWWPWVLAPRGNYRGFNPTGNMPAGVMLRTRAGGDAKNG